MYLNKRILDCAGKAKRRRRFSHALTFSPKKSGVALRFPPQSKNAALQSRDQERMWPPRRALKEISLTALASRCSCLFYHGENVPCGIPKPGNGGTISTHNAFLVCLEIGQIIDLEADPLPRQFIDRTIDIFHREVQNGKAGRNMVGLWINENIIVTGEGNVRTP